MQQISSVESAFRFALPQVRLRPRWLAPALVTVALALGLAFVMDARAPAPAAHAAAAAPAPMPAPYVGSDPSLPSADGVNLPDPEPHIEAF